MKIDIDHQSLTGLKKVTEGLLAECPPLAQRDDLNFEYSIAYRQHLTILDTWFEHYLKKGDQKCKMKVSVNHALALLWLMSNWDYFANPYIGAILSQAEQGLGNLIFSHFQNYQHDTRTHLLSDAYNRGY